MNRKRMSKDNKGFSLVELIVVVLIMAILAVALAPQVTKWVENAREARDITNFNQMYSDLQIIMANGDTISEMKASVDDYYLVIESTGSKLTKGDARTEVNSGAVYDELNERAPGWETFKMLSTELATNYEIMIMKGADAGRIHAVSGKTPVLTGDPWE